MHEIPYAFLKASPLYRKMDENIFKKDTGFMKPLRK